MSSVGQAAAKQKFLAFLKSKSLRLTSQRLAIVDTVFATSEHFTADHLLSWSRREDSSISRATVYRTLALLTESGLVRELDLGGDHTFYDPNYAEHPEHNHIVCNDCNRIVEFESDSITRLERQITHQLGFSVQSQRLHITASCDEFKRLGRCTKRSDAERF